MVIKEEDLPEPDFVPRLGMKVRKYFPKSGWFNGVIISGPEEDPKTGESAWRVQYTDGDIEDYTRDELIPILVEEEGQKRYILMSDRGEERRIQSNTNESTPTQNSSNSSKPANSSNSKPSPSKIAVETVTEDQDDEDAQSLPELRDRQAGQDDESDDDDSVDDPIPIFPRRKPGCTPMDDPPLKDWSAAMSKHPTVDTPDTKPDVPGSTTTRKDKPVLKPHDTGLKPDDLVDRTFLLPPNADGTRQRARIVKMINKHLDEIEDDPDRKAELAKFKVIVDDKWEDVVAYNDIIEHIEKDETWDGSWRFEEVLRHKSVTRSDPEYLGSGINLLVRKTTGEISWEPLSTRDKTGIWDTCPVIVAIYARENDLLYARGWRLPGLTKMAKTQKRLVRRANQAKLHSFRHAPKYMYGVQVPRNYHEAMELDRKNGNTLWRDSVELELGQVQEYKSFRDMGKGYDPGPGYKKINVHLVFAVKHDGRRKSRLVAGGHLTDTPIDSVYSSVVSLRGIRLLTFVAELNDQQVWCTDIGNAYLESLTFEKVYIIAGPEFGDLEGHTLIIQKALYGLKSSGLRWHERFSDVLRDMGFVPSKAERDIWMRDRGDHYEYIAVYVDDLLIVSKDPEAIIESLTKKYNFKLKGTGPISFHLGCDFGRDKDGTLYYAPKKYIDKILDNYRRIFGQLPKKASSPLPKGCHPELDTTDLLDFQEQKIYQSLIGALQWVIQIGRFDVCTAVMTLSRFRAAPRKGHLELVKRVHGYLSHMRHGKIRIRTDKPDYSDIPIKEFDWKYSCYPDAKEQVPDNCPTPRGKSVNTTSFYDANLYHDLISGRSVTGILHLVNQTPVDWFSKLQATVETATFGSEYVAARICTEQIIDLRLTLRYLGVPIDGSSMIFGDNESVVNATSHPHGKLHKRHNALAYHKTREAVAAGMTRMHHVRSQKNAADILSKHWDYPSVWGSLKPLLFWEGDTADADLPHWRGAQSRAAQKQTSDDTT